MAPGFWARVREARLMRVVVVYLAASWLVLQVSALLQGQLQLPHWLTPVVVVLLLGGLVVMLATAWVQSHPVVKAREAELPSAWEVDLKDLTKSVVRGRLPHLTWARAILGGVFALSVAFGVAGAYVLFTERRVEGEAAPAARPDRKMLVVLPFENLGPADDEYFADGMTEEITARLAAVDGLGVIGRTSAILYKRAEKRIQEIGRELGVHYILEGTVRWQRPAGGPARVRVTPQLVRVADGTHLWAEVYDEPLHDRGISLSPDVPWRYDWKAWLYVLWQGNTQKARAVLEHAEKVGLADDPFVLFPRVLVDVFHARYQEPLHLLSSVAPGVFQDQFHFTPRAQLYAQIYGLMKHRGLERAYYDSSRIVAESKLREDPEDPRLHSALGIAYARLGRKEEAIREGKKAVELLPIQKEAWRGYRREVDLARIYVMVGEYDAAIERLEYLLSIPGDLTAAWLRIDPTWAPLRSHPRFQKLLEKGD